MKRYIIYGLLILMWQVVRELFGFEPAVVGLLVLIWLSLPNPL